MQVSKNSAVEKSYFSFLALPAELVMLIASFLNIKEFTFFCYLQKKHIAYYSDNNQWKKLFEENYPYIFNTLVSKTNNPILAGINWKNEFAKIYFANKNKITHGIYRSLKSIQLDTNLDRKNRRINYLIAAISMGDSLTTPLYFNLPQVVFNQIYTITHKHLGRSYPPFRIKTNEIGKSLAQMYLKWAILTRQPKKELQKIIDSHPEISAKLIIGFNAINYAARIGYIDAIEFILNLNPSLIKNRNEKGMTPLICAAEGGHLQACLLMIEAIKLRGKSAAFKLLNHQDKQGRSALHFAAKQGDIAIITVLIDEKIDLDLEDKNNNTALHLAIFAKKKDVANELIKRGASIRIRNSQGQTALSLINKLHDPELKASIKLSVNKGKSADYLCAFNFFRCGNLSYYFSTKIGHFTDKIDHFFKF
jgi:hypothetical protein